MVGFLIRRPIAVIMAFTACFIIGLLTYFTLPVSLLPDIAIPEITVQVSVAGSSARELENTVVKPLRQQLIQVARLQDITSTSRDGTGTIRLGFDFGTDTDLAFIEVNEKIDAAMNYLPKEIERPKVIKASATDIPVFYLCLTLREEADSTTLSPRFLELGEFAQNVVKRRLEQLPQVAMVDITGVVRKQLQIAPDQAKMAIAGLTLDDIRQALERDNVEPGSMTVRDGHYQYNIKFSTLLRTAADVSDIYLQKEGCLFRLGDFCDVQVVPVQENGISMSGGKRAVTLAVIKQADEQMDALKRAVTSTIDEFKAAYPDIDFHVSRNQTELLDYTISNLKQNLVSAFLLICILAALFMGDARSPFVIGLGMAVSLAVCFLFFYLFKISLNIISLSGLVLASGMMIDNSIIVTENIAQYRERGYPLMQACVAGTSEMITPMLSSSLTTVAVFVPLVFMSGIAGALFFDQAFAVTAGLLVSYFTSIMLLPVLYRSVYQARPRGRGLRARLGIHNPLKAHATDRIYDKGVDWVFSHKRLCLAVCIASLPLSALFILLIGKERMPRIDHNELIARVEWNEHVHVEENRRRVERLFARFEPRLTDHAASIGTQDYLLEDDALTASEASLYFKTATSRQIAPLQAEVDRWVRQQYPEAVITFSPPENLFERLFDTDRADIVAELYTTGQTSVPDAATLRSIRQRMARLTGTAPQGIAFENQLDLAVMQERLLLYNVSFETLENELKTAFKQNDVATLRSSGEYMPVSVAGEGGSINQVLQETLVPSAPDKEGVVSYIPLARLLEVTPSEDLKSITAGRAGEYIPFLFHDVRRPLSLMDGVRQAVPRDSGREVSFTGSYFTDRQMLEELAVVLAVSVLLMYFILAAQFESFLQPLVVLLEIPVDVAFAVALLWACGHTLNLMSAIGIIVTCGIIINDSILKLSAINELRRAGTPLLEAIHEAGRRRLRPIIMTSLTTIFAMMPLLFRHDMGSELQQPLAVAIIGAMAVGTLVSLFIIPLIYWYIYKKQPV